VAVRGESTTADVRQGRRQQPPAAAAQEAWDRVDPSSSLESQKARASPIRVEVQDVPVVSLGRLPDEHTSAVVRPLLSYSVRYLRTVWFGHARA